MPIGPDRNGATLNQPPPEIAALGNLDVLQRPALALFCSVRYPGNLILQTYDLARTLRDIGITVIGGFHSLMQKESLRLLLRGTQPVIACPARSIDGMRIPSEWRQPLEDGRLLVLSSSPASQRRATAAAANARNELVAAISEAVFVAHASPGGKTEELCRHVAAWGKPLLTFADPHNEHLLALGARAVAPGNMVQVVRGLARPTSLYM